MTIMYNKDIRETNNSKENKMSNIEKASARVHELVNQGVRLSEAVVKASKEFGVLKSTLMIEWI